MRISRKLGLWRARDVESLVLDNVSTFLLFFCTPLIFAQSFFSWDVVLVMINRGRLRSGYRLLSWGVAASATHWAREHPCLGTAQSLYERTTLTTPAHDWAEQLSDLVFFYQTLWGRLAMSSVPLKEGYGEDAKNNSFVDHHYLLPSLRVSIGKEFRWDKPHLISCGLLQHTALAGQTVAEFIVTFCL